MNPQKALRFAPKTIRSTNLTADVLCQSTLPTKLNPNKIAKQSYQSQTNSEKAFTNKRRNTVKDRERNKTRLRITKNTSMSDLDHHSLDTGLEAHETLEPVQVFQSISGQGKENFSIENLEMIQNSQDASNYYYQPQIASLKDSKKISDELSSERPELQQKDSRKLNRFSTFEDPCSPSTPIATNNSKFLQSSQGNDYSDRETAAESVYCLSEANIGSQTRLTKGSTLKNDNTFERYTETKGPFWNSQENSCCTTLDCEEALGFNNSALLEEKKDDSIPSDFDFEQDFALFSSNSASPNDKQFSEEATPSVESKPTKEKSIEDEIANFNPEINPCAFDSDTINYLIMREATYGPDPHFLEKKQTQINWTMRAILLDWMMEVCMEFGLKRETFHYGVNYVDRYLSAVPNIQKVELQLIGVTAIYMASKVEEIFPPRVASFAKSTDSAYTPEQIMAMELKMLKALQWLLTPPTLNTWANWYMNQWDLYLERSEYAQKHALVVSQGEDLIQFKQSNQKSYARFREMMQMIDCAMLDIQTLQYKPRAIIASIMYVLLGRYLKQYTTQQIYEEFPRNSSYLLDKSSSFNDLFGNFLLYSFGFELSDLLPSIQYVSTYIRLPISLELPKAVKMNKENVLEGHFEEFLAFQTHHSNNIQYIRRRPRNNL